MAKCRIDRFRLRGTGSMCHMFLLNVEFSNACRFRVFQCHFSTVSCFPFPCFQLPKCWHGRTEYWKLPAFLYQTFKMLWRIFRADNVFVRFYGLFRYFISSYFSTRCWIFHCTVRFINQISKEVPYETLSIRYHFYKIVHENTLALTLPCFIWVSRAIAKHARIVLSVFCQCSSFVVNGIAEI